MDDLIENIKKIVHLQSPSDLVYGV